MNNKILVVIPVYGIPDILKLTLAQVDFHAPDHLDVEVNLTDNTEDMHQKRLIQEISLLPYVNITVKYTDMQGNKGFAAACNAGIESKKADQDFVILLNSDAIISSDIFSRLLTIDADITGIVTNRAGNIQDVTLPVQISEDELLKSDEKELEKITTYAKQRAIIFDKEVWNVDFVTFFCVGIKSSVFEKIGLLDETFWPGGYEDDDFCLRAQKNGLSIVLDRSVFVFHLGSASFAQKPMEDRQIWNMRNRRRLEEKHEILWKSHENEIKESARRDREKYQDFRIEKSDKQIDSSYEVIAEMAPLKKSTKTKFKILLDEFRDNLVTLRAVDPNLIVLSSKFPEDHDLKDGYFLRVKQVDDLLEDLSIKRIYVNTTLNRSDVKILGENSFEISFSNRYNMTLFLLLTLVQVKRFYIHSILRLQNGYVRRILKMFKPEILLDIHGVVPEEARLSSGFLHAQRLETIEKEAFSMSQNLVAVTNQMTQHFGDKYDLSSKNFAVFPTIQGLDVDSVPEKTNQYDFAYIGGTQPWQNLHYVLEIAQNELKRYSWLFIIPNEAEFTQRFGPLRMNISIKSAKGASADLLLRHSRFGILIRENSIVNQVSFPTKISDYVRNGCIPVTGEGIIGGVKDLQLNFLLLENIVLDGLPSNEEAQRLSTSNLERYLRASNDRADQIVEMLEKVLKK